MERWPIGVFASIDAGLGVHLDVARELDVPTIQLHAPQAASRTAPHAEKFLQTLADYGLTLTAVFGGFDGESYADIPTTQRTVGIVPTVTRDARVAEMKQISDFASLLDCRVVALHLGFIPHPREAGEEYAAIVAATRTLCDHAAGNRQDLHLETGQETADDLLQFVADVQRENLFINFDPANMILYGTGEPIEALRQLGRLVHSVHCKDATWSDKPGTTWGREVPLGEGDVGMENYLRTLHEIGYTGPLTIEREIPQEPARQQAEIGHAVQLLTDLRLARGIDFQPTVVRSPKPTWLGLPATVPRALKPPHAQGLENGLRLGQDAPATVACPQAHVAGASSHSPSCLKTATRPGPGEWSPTGARCPSHRRSFPQPTWLGLPATVPRALKPPHAQGLENGLRLGQDAPATVVRSPSPRGWGFQPQSLVLETATRPLGHPAPSRRGWRFKPQSVVPQNRHTPRAWRMLCDWGKMPQPPSSCPHAHVAGASSRQSDEPKTRKRPATGSWLRLGARRPSERLCTWLGLSSHIPRA